MPHFNASAIIKSPIIMALILFVPFTKSNEYYSHFYVRLCFSSEITKSKFKHLKKMYYWPANRKKRKRKTERAIDQMLGVSRDLRHEYHC